MITLARDCLLFRLKSGESIPYSVDMMAFEPAGSSAPWVDTEHVHDAAKAVFHYFKYEEQRQSVTIGEFAGALEKVLHGVNLTGHDPSCCRIAESDLRRLVRIAGKGCELFFFPLLRNELRQQMSTSPRIVRFKGLRGCVKQLAGSRRWSHKCQRLQLQIVEFLRHCLSSEKHPTNLALVVE